MTSVVVPPAAPYFRSRPFRKPVERTKSLFRQIGHDEWGGAYTLANLGVVALERGELERALALLAESLSLYKKREDKAGVALALINLGDVARKRGDEEQAVSLYNDALTLHRKPENERGVAHALRASLAFSKALDGPGGPNK